MFLCGHATMIKQWNQQLHVLLYPLLMHKGQNLEKQVRMTVQKVSVEISVWFTPHILHGANFDKRGRELEYPILYAAVQIQWITIEHSRAHNPCTLHKIAIVV